MNFVKKNKEVAIEIVTLQDLGYMLADNQANLTVKQKLFLNIAVPLVREIQEKEQNSNKASNSLKDRVRAKKREQNGGIEI